MGSRLVNATIPEEAKFPAILPKEGEEVKALIRKYHREERHAGAKHTVCQMRQRFWILQGMQATKKEINRCVICQKAHKAPESQKMAPLPIERVSQTAPFYNTGVDMMGPFMTKMNGRALHKVYVAVFTCFESRSVHAEMVYKMDASSMINAMVRFTARRPGVTKMFSDRGTNFVATNSILKKELKGLNEATAPQLLKRGIE